MTLTLYSHKKCPFCLRARVALHYASVPFITQEVDLKNKPKELLKHSQTVPLLLLEDETTIQESLDIMLFALNLNDKDNWLFHKQEAMKLLERFNKDYLPYKREQIGKNRAQDFLESINTRLQDTCHILRETPSLIDMALFPFLKSSPLTHLFPHITTWIESIRPLFLQYDKRS